MPCAVSVMRAGKREEFKAVQEEWGGEEWDFKPLGCCLLAPGLPPDYRKLQGSRGTLMSTDLRTPARPRDTIGFGTEFRFYLLCIYFHFPFAAETPEDDGQFYLKISILVVMHGQTRDGPLITERGGDGTNRDILYEPEVCTALAKTLANTNFENPIIQSNVPSSMYF